MKFTWFGIGQIPAYLAIIVSLNIGVIENSLKWVENWIGCKPGGGTAKKKIIIEKNFV